MIKFNALSFKSAVAAATLLLLAACGSAEEQAKGYYQSGMEYLDKSDYERAAVEFRNALKINENYADAWFGMAQVEQHNQSWERVYGNLTKVLEINPKHVPALAGIATLQGASGDYSNALKNATLASELDPKNPDLLALKATILLQIGDMPGAVAEANKALALAPNHGEASGVIIADLIERKDFTQALAVANASIAANPTQLSPYLSKLAAVTKAGDRQGQVNALQEITAAFPNRREFKVAYVDVLVKSGQSDKAEAELRTLVNSNPGDFAARADLVRFLQSTRGGDAARNELLGIIASEKRASPYQIMLANLDFANGRQDDAIALLRTASSALGITEDGIAVRVKLAQLLVRNKDAAGASIVIDDILANDSQNVDALTLRGAINIEAGNTEQSINDLRTASNLSNTNGNIRALLATAYERSGQPELAAREWAEATKASGFDPEIGINQAQFLIRRGSSDRAIEVLRELATRRPKNERILTELANLLVKTGDLAAAEEVARTLKDASSDPAAADVILGEVLIRQRQPQDAVAILQSTAQKSPTNAKVLRTLVQAYIQSGKTEDAASFLDAALKANPNNVDALVLNGVVLLRQNNDAGAKTQFEQAIAADPTYAQAYIGLSDYYSHTGDQAKSIAILLQGKGMSKDSFALNLVIAARYEAQAEYEKAIAAYEEALTSDADALAVINNLVSFLTDHRDDADSLARAASLAERLRFSQVPAFRETLGWTLVRSGKAKQGLGLLERAADDMPNEAVAHMHLGIAYAETGDKEQAIKQLNIALTLAKSPDLAAKIKERLTGLGESKTP